MTRFMLLTGAAALAIGSAGAATAQGKGNGNNKGNNGSAKVERSHKASHGAKGNHKANHKASRGESHRAQVHAKNNGNGNAKAKFKADDKDDRKFARADRDDRRFDRDDRRDRDDRPFDRDRSRFDGNNRGGAWANANRNGWCPPGLRNKTGPGECMPPGQAKQMEGQSLRVLRSRLGDRLTLRELPLRLRSLYRDDDDTYYRYGNGYVYKVDRDNDVIRSLLPLFGLGAGIGQQFPSAYGNSFLPMALQAFYPRSQQNSFRYANGYVYNIDPMTGMIRDIDPMLGYGYGYGQMMPASYSAYNVPTQYRSFYQDNNDHLYRYAPGSIYRVDAGSGLIDSVAALLMPGGMSVGQPMPMGYDAYNVPYQYRSQYYDTPQNMYRYANGSIYQVDPTTRLVTAIISALI